jgi:hypothetical protein
MYTVDAEHVAAKLRERQRASASAACSMALTISITGLHELPSQSAPKPYGGEDESSGYKRPICSNQNFRVALTGIFFPPPMTPSSSLRRVSIPG